MKEFFINTVKIITLIWFLLFLFAGALVFLIGTMPFIIGFVFQKGASSMVEYIDNITLPVDKWIYKYFSSEKSEKRLFRFLNKSFSVISLKFHPFRLQNF